MCLPLVGHKFYIQLALPISPEIMDGFWCSRCLNDRIKVPDMMRLFAGGATTPWWWKFELNKPGWKLSIRVTLIAISHYLEAKFDYGYLIIFLCYGSKILHKKSQVISTKNEGVTVIFPEFWFDLIDHCLHKDRNCQLDRNEIHTVGTDNSNIFH